MNPRRAVVFTTSERGHFKRMRSVVASLVTGGIETYVFSDARFRDEVERAGGRFVDLYAGRTVASVDATSIPVPSRFVTFAGRHGDTVTREVQALRPSLVVHDTFAVIARVVAHHLAVPRVNVCAGHRLVPGPTIEAVCRDVSTNPSPACLDAVRTLRERHGVEDATPFAYVSGAGADLNLYCEPPQFLRPPERAPFEPIEFFGSLSGAPAPGERSGPSPFGREAADKLRIYASFGTVIWRYFESTAMAALEVLAEAVARRTDAVAIVSFAGVSGPERAARLSRHNVVVHEDVDQERVLGHASVYLTHQGLNSTHEAIFHRVPMISYPFFWDQPALAERCVELGLAVPLAAAPRGRVRPEDVEAALCRVSHERDAIRSRLDEAREWELETIRRRGEVVERVARLTRRADALV